MYTSAQQTPQRRKRRLNIATVFFVVATAITPFKWISDEVPYFAETSVDLGAPRDDKIPLGPNNNHDSINVESNSKRKRVEISTRPHNDTRPRISPSRISNSTYFGFIRIQKTGSTSVLSFLKYTSGLHSWDNFLNNANGFIQSIHKSLRFTPFCVFGHATNGVEDNDVDDGPNPFNITDARFLHNKCPHMPYSALEKSWRMSLLFSKQQPDSVSLQTFTMVREPYSRLRSLFYYVQKFCNTTQAWRDLFSPEQYDCVCKHNDLEGWIELLHNQSATRPSRQRLPFQYPFLSWNVDKAIEMIEGDDPLVYVLLNECFEESLRFLEHKFSLTPGAVDRFVLSNNFTANANNMEANPRESHGKIQSLAERRFPKDFQFYNAAENQFRRQLALMKLDRLKLVNPCYIWEPLQKDETNSDPKDTSNDRNLLEIQSVNL